MTPAHRKPTALLCSGCARLGSGVAPPLGVLKKEVAVLVILVRRHRRAIGAAVRRVVDDKVPGAVEEEAGPAAVRRVPPGLLDALQVHALGALGIVVVVRDVGPRQVVCDDVTNSAVLLHSKFTHFAHAHISCAVASASSCGGFA